MATVMPSSGSLDVTQPSLQMHGHWPRPKDQRIRQGEGAREVRVVLLNRDSGVAYRANGLCVVLNLNVLDDDVVNAVTVID